MKQEHAVKSRRSFRWPKEARELVRIHTNAHRAQTRPQNPDNELGMLVTKLVHVSGNPRDACWRFVRQSGIVGKRAYQQWPKQAQQKFLDLMAVQPLPEDEIGICRCSSPI